MENKYLEKIAEKQPPVSTERATLNAMTRSGAEGVVGAGLGGYLGTKLMGLAKKNKGLAPEALLAEKVVGGVLGTGAGWLGGKTHGTYASIQNTLDSHK